MDIFIQFAIAASQFAMDDAGLEVTPDDAPRVGVFIASGIGGFATIEREHKALLEGGPRTHLPVLHPVGHHQPGRRPGVDPLRRQGAELGDLHRVLAPRRTPSATPSRSSSAATPTSMIAGGAEAAITPMGVGGFAAHARAVDAQRRARSAPAARSTGTATASSSARASGVVVLEELEFAPARAARTIYAELVGYGMSADAYPHHRAVRGRRRRGARDAGGARKTPASSRTQVDYINAHGTSTPLQRHARDAGDQAVLRRARAQAARSRRPSR